VQRWLCADVALGEVRDPLVALLVFLALLELEPAPHAWRALRRRLADALEAETGWLEGLRTAGRIDETSLAEVFERARQLA